jgi:asparagine synthase (glutamine-hydrolysing)
VGYDVSGASQKEAEESNEFGYAREAAAHLGAEHFEYHLKAREFEEAIPAIVSHLDEPLADPSCIPLYFISKMARGHITVVLSGEGADETLAGYNLYQRLLRLEKVRKGIGPLASLSPLISHLPVGDRLRHYLRCAGLPLEAHYRGVVKGVTPETRLQLTGPDRLLQCEQDLDDVFGVYFRNVSTASPLNRMLYADAKVWLPENLLLKADKMTMAAAVELRVPFLDHKLVEFTAALPQSFKLRDTHGKWILRHMMGTVLPPSIIHRTKKGFPSPTAAWLRSEMREFVCDTLLSRGAACRKFFEMSAVEDVIQRHFAGKFSGYQEVWSLLVFEHWHRQFIESSPGAVDRYLQGYYVVNS